MRDKATRLGFQPTGRRFGNGLTPSTWREMAERPTSDEIEITPAMVKAGVDALREIYLGADLGDAAKAVYFAMEYQRLDERGALRD